MIEVVIFDMDDTLYPEIDYVKSGYKHIASYLSNKLNMNAENVYNDLISIFNKNSNNVFNQLFELYNIKYTTEDIKVLIEEYRNHSPNIKLFDDVIPYFNNLKKDNIQIGLITDGYQNAQRNKIKSLKLENVIDYIIVTDELGREYWKPHQKSFIMMKEYFNVDYKKMVYIGDNIKKDFKAGNELGMDTIMITRENNIYKNIDVEDIYKPKKNIKKLE